MSFITKSIEELDHVVWPTNAESKKYMYYTVGTIVVMATLLAVIGYVISGTLKAVRDQFPHEAIVTSTVSGEDNVTEADIEKLKKEIERKRNSLSGAKIEVNGTENNGVTTTPLQSGSGN